ncbi:LVIVD repeat-containing protein [Halomicrobium zhouii]|uniref:LVIVD repeat-containing protein n=1 Tax=Halomicrobium zhouii TaxID=767519 RepID=A0A1I6L5T1_9EURY|nr:hypothetical protein [Halomicrobium zhouii]SFR98831.1 LVIVD repeat-containing protein [Halomicrobium zhouii]
MHRRSFLRAACGSAVLGSVGTASAHPKGSGGGQGTPVSETPTGPDPLGSLRLAGAKEAVVRDGTTVFLATTDGFAVVDVSDPADLAVAYSSDAVLDDHEHGPMRQIWDVKVDGDCLLVVGPANGGVDAVHAAVVYDVGDPTEPDRVAVHETDYPIHNAFLADGVAYLTANDFESNWLVTVDADSGEEFGRWSLLDHDEAWGDVEPVMRVLHDVWVADDIAYLAHWDAGTWILDVSDPASPEFLSRVRGRPVEELAAVANTSEEATALPGNDHFVTVDESGTLLGVGVESWAVEDGADVGPGGIHLYDVSDPTDPRERATIDPPPSPDPTRSGVWTTAHNFELADGRCYSSWYQGGVKVHDVSEPSTPRELFHWRDGSQTKFWTAQRGVPGEFFLASSWESPGDEDGAGGLYVFPDPAPAEPATESGATDSAGDGGIGSLVGLGALTGAGLGALGFSAWRARR